MAILMTASDFVPHPPCVDVGSAMAAPAPTCERAGTAYQLNNRSPSTFSIVITEPSGVCRTLTGSNRPAR